MRSRYHKPKHDFLRREIHRLRIEQEVSLEDLAEAAGYSNHGHLGKWLNSDPGVDIPVARLHKILHHLGHEVTIAPRFTE